MADLIDRQELISWISKDPLFPQVESFGLTSVIKSRPSVDAVPVVRCKDCKFRNRVISEGYCRYIGIFVEDDFFCAWGERKDNEAQTDKC